MKYGIKCEELNEKVLLCNVNNYKNSGAIGPISLIKNAISTFSLLE
jgi:hypothetical protein